MELFGNQFLRMHSGIVLVKKNNGEHRLCIDYRQLNKITVKIQYHMPIIEDLLAQLAGYRHFTTLDLRMGYLKIEIQLQSKKFTAFVTYEGHYEYHRIPLAYFNDVIVPSRTVDEGIDRLNRF